MEIRLRQTSNIYFKKKTKIIIFTNLNNQTGTVLSEEEAKELPKIVLLYFSISQSTPLIVSAMATLSDDRGEKAMGELKKKFAQSREAICQHLDRLLKLFS